MSGVMGWVIAQPSDDELADIDVGFLTDMSIHHNGAISLGFLYLGREHDPVVGHFAREIVVTQSAETSAMNGWLADADVDGTIDRKVMAWMGHPAPAAEMPGMPTEAEVGRLRTAVGLDADDLFTRLMILHHGAGADMAEDAGRHGRHPEVTRFARAVAKIQRTEIDQMNARRRRLGLPTVEPEPIPADGLGHGSH